MHSNCILYSFRSAYTIFDIYNVFGWGDNWGNGKWWKQNGNLWCIIEWRKYGKNRGFDEKLSIYVLSSPPLTLSSVVVLFLLYIYIYEEMGSNYTFFKLLDLSRFNGQKNTLINTNILIKISLIIPHLLYFISISKPKKKKMLYLTLYVSLCLSPPPLFHLHERQ